MSLLKNIWNFIKRLIGNITEETRDLAPEIIQIVTNVKNFVDSPEADFITLVIPGTLDDTVKGVVSVGLSKLLLILNKVESIALIEDENERNKAIVKEIKLSDDDTKDIAYHTLAGKLIQYVTGNDWGKSVIIAEAGYQEPDLLKK